MSALQQHFDRLYETQSDPWQVATRWYEQRKQGVLLACLPRQRYARAFEPGCGTGELSRELAARCDSLLASDGSMAAVRLARAKLDGLPGVSVVQQRLPADWPTGTFDLVVLSEWLYYLDQPGLRTVVELARRSLAPDGTLVTCHWAEDFADRQVSNAEIHAAWAQLPGLDRVVCHGEPDFVLEVWSRTARPVAAEESNGGRT